MPADTPVKTNRFRLRSAYLRASCLLGLLICVPLLIAQQQPASTEEELNPDIKPQPGWVTGKDYLKALEKAYQAGRPLVVVETRGRLNDNTSISTVRNVMNHRAFRGTVNVLMYTEVVNDNFVGSQLDVLRFGMPLSNLVPRIWILDTMGNLLFFVSHDNINNDLNNAMRYAMQITRWQGGQNRMLERAERSAENGHFRSAFDLLLEINEDDGKMTTRYLSMINDLYGKPYTKENRIIASIPLPGRFYRRALVDVQKSLVLLADDRLAEAEELFKLGRYADAEAIIRPMVSDSLDIEPVRKAVKLLQKIREARRNSD